MKKAVRIILAAALLGALVWFIIPSRTESEPRYQGKPLSKWLPALDTAKRGRPGLSRRDAARAVRQAGTNAIPTLLRMFRTTDPPWRTKLLTLLQKQPIIPIYWTTASSLHRQAEAAFELLGSRAQAASPELLKLRDHKPPLDCQQEVRWVIQNIHQSQRPLDSYYINLMSDTKLQMQAEGALCLCTDLGAGAGQSAVPTLLDLLKGQRPTSYWLKFLLEEADPETAAGVLTNRDETASHPAGSSEINNLGFLDNQGGDLLAAGEWSQPVRDNRSYNSLRGRLLAYAGSHYTDRQGEWWGNARVYLELQDVGGSLGVRQTEVYFAPQASLNYELRDAQGRLVPPGPSAAPSPVLRASWTTIPFDSTVRFRVDLSMQASHTQPDGLVLALASGSWRLPTGDTNTYFLSATFHPPTNSPPSVLDYMPWSGTLNLPTVKLGLTRQAP